MTGDSLTDGWKAPYISYQTLTNFIDEKLGDNPLPPRIDRGFLDNYAGSVQAQLLSALRTMGMVSEDGVVEKPLRDAVGGSSARKQVVRTWAESFYEEQLKLATENATAQMLHESFARHKYSGSTLRKAVVFYLSLVDDVGLPKSPHFKPPRQAMPGGTRQPRKKVANPTPPVVDTDGMNSPIVAGEQKVISLGAAGDVTVHVNVRWLELSEDKFLRLRKAIRDLEDLAEDAPSDRSSPPDEAVLDA